MIFDVGSFGGSLINSALSTGLQLANWRREDKYNQKMWDRDDTAVQRRVADLKAAGLSPVLAAGSAAGNSSPVLSSLKPSETDIIGNYLANIQGKANISQTNAQTDLTNMQLTSEEFKQGLLNSQIDYTKAMADNYQKQNAWYDADMLSTLNLRGKEAEKIKGEIAFNLANTALTQSRTALTDAQTTYQQVKTDHERTLHDISMINRDQANFDLTTSGLRLYNDTWSKNKGLIGNIFGDARNLWTGFDIRHAIKNVDGSWYWNKR